MSRSKVLLVAVVVAVLAGAPARRWPRPAAEPSRPGPDAPGARADHQPRPRVRAGGAVPHRRHPPAAAGLGNNATRNFLVSGSTGFAAQGGNSTGCGVPEGALAAELTIISADASGPGLLRAYPFGGQPTATILAYQNGPNLLNTGTVALCDPSAAAARRICRSSPSRPRPR